MYINKKLHEHAKINKQKSRQTPDVNISNYRAATCREMEMWASQDAGWTAVTRPRGQCLHANCSNGRILSNLPGRPAITACPRDLKGSCVGQFLSGVTQGESLLAQSPQGYWPLRPHQSKENTACRTELFSHRVVHRISLLLHITSWISKWEFLGQQNGCC